MRFYAIKLRFQNVLVQKLYKLTKEIEWPTFQNGGSVQFEGLEIYKSLRTYSLNDYKLTKREVTGMESFESTKHDWWRKG